MDLSKELSAEVASVKGEEDVKPQVQAANPGKRKAPETSESSTEIHEQRFSKRLQIKREATSRLESQHEPPPEQLPGSINRDGVQMPEEDNKELALQTSSGSIRPVLTHSARSAPRTKVPPHKVNTDALALNPELVEEYLAYIPTLTIHPAPIPLKIHLPYLSKAYGAATQALLWTNANKTGSGTTAHTTRKFIYPNFETNPDTPAAPGEPGILLTGRVEMLDGTWSLFIRVIDDSASKLVRWTYAGEYASKRIGELSPSEFQAKPQEVKNTWGKKIADHKKHPVYVDMRARIQLRKKGMKVTDESMAKERALIKNTAKGRSSLSVNDVVQAFCKGEETISIVLMHCVSYDHQFAEEIQADYTEPTTRRK